MAANRKFVMPRLQVTQLGSQGRINRYPRHIANTAIVPYVITPFLLAPVLPGETLKNLLLQARAVTSPTHRRSAVIGAHMEYYFFYVSFTMMPGAADFTNLMVDPSQSLAAYIVDGGNKAKYVFDDGVDWTTQCLAPVVEHYFRDEGEAWNLAAAMWTVGGESLPIAQWQPPGWLDSVVNKDTVVDPLDLTIDQTPTADISIADIDAKLRQYKFLVDNGLTDMTYEDYLRTYGVRVPEVVEPTKPELLRYVREWAYPTRATSIASSDTAFSVAAGYSYNIAERADKDRFFSEPGFIFGVSVFRPKLYSSKQSGAAAGLMASPYAWLPAIMSDDPRTSLLAAAAGDGPLQSATVETLTDIKDLLLYGDQWVWRVGDPAAHTGSVGGAEVGAVALPSNDLSNKKYPQMQDLRGMFVVTATDATEAPYNVDNASSIANIEAVHDENVQDIVVSMTIAGRQVDRT